MKTFIVFLALILVFTCLCINSDDTSHYKQLNIHLKALAEEAARGGALMTAGSFATSTAGISILETDAMEYANFVTEKASENMPIFSNGSLAVSSLEILSEGTAIRVAITFIPNSLIFHIWEIEPKPITRVATYEWRYSEK